MSEKDTRITINIDGQDILVAPGANVIDAAASADKEIPHFCYHPHLSVSGNCRMCLVEMGTPMRDRATNELVLDEQGKPKIAFMPKPVIACATKASPGMHIRTITPAVKDCQNGVMEFLLANHPLDCPICDKAGECRLQEFAADYGRGFSRFVENKNVKPKRTKLGPRVMLDDERCILCSRCIRFSKEVAKDDVLGFVDRGSYSTLTCFPGKELSHNYSLNVVDICPVGALTSTDFRFKMRVWFLKPANSICTESSVGTNTQVWSREGEIYRITPRRNDQVNDSWMTDSGRELYKQVASEKRIAACLLEGENSCPTKSAAAAATLLAQGVAAYVGSGRMSVEEQFLLKKIVSVAPGKVHFVHHQGAGDGLLLSADRTPNLRGGLLTGLIDKLPSEKLSDLASDIDAGKVKTLFVIGEDLTEAGLTEAQLSKVTIIYMGTHANKTSAKAKVLIPALTVFEKAGSFVNQQFRLQRFDQCLPPRVSAHPEIVTLAGIYAHLKKEQVVIPAVSDVWQELSRNAGAFSGVSFEKIPLGGVLLEAGELAKLPFCEGPSLHYKPAANA